MPNHHQAPKRGRTIKSFFKPRSDNSENDAPSSSVHTSLPNEPPSKVQIVEDEEVEAQRVQPQGVQNAPIVQPQEVDVSSLPSRDPGLRIPIMQYPVNERDKIRKQYMEWSPYQPKLDNYPNTRVGKQNRRFQYAWFTKFSWLEYSPTKDAAFCFYSYLFETDPPKRPAFTSEGFKSWKRINDGESCSFLAHVGKTCSLHLCAVKSAEFLINPSQHIDQAINTQRKEDVERNRLRLKVTIECVRWLALQACAFRGHDESINSENRGNFVELVKLLAKSNENIAKVVLQNAQGNAKYTSPLIEKEILYILSSKVRNMIRKEVGDAKWCILVDESLDESNREQMSIVLRFVNGEGFVRERFFDVQRVEDTTSLTLRNKICEILTQYNLHIENMRGQGYDGANNMRGSLNGLQALFLKECPYAYYVHCFAHRLQLALVKAATDLGTLWKFFSMLTSVVNLVTGSSKHHGEFESAQEDEIARKLANGELETSRGVNQIGNLQRAGATRWSSHYGLVSSLIDLFDPTCTVIQSIKENKTSPSRGEADSVYEEMRSLKFVFVLHMVNSIMGITEVLCQALQQKSQDIVNAMKLVTSTKELLLKLRLDGWDTFLKSVELFCELHDIYMPDMTSRYMVGTSRSCQQRDYITVEHHYHIDIFNVVIDFQVVELNTRFPEETMELLILSTALDPRESFKSFKIEDICRLAEKYYPRDFTKQEILVLKSQLQHYELNVTRNSDFQNLSTISELCRRLVETRKSEAYKLVDILIRLVLTLPVSTATTERSFSTMKLVKTALRNKMEDEFLRDCMIIHIERKLVENISSDWVIETFDSIKDRRVKFA